jgi:PadR family transcriptional regulator, regulatory protein PadR
MGAHIGEFEELVLMSVAILHRSAYGLSVREFLLEQTTRKTALRAIHATLYRLQTKGLLSSDLEGATPTRGGRRKRVFSVTNLGMNAVRDARQTRD